MCVVIDTCVLNPCFVENSKNRNYIPVRKWIISGKGKIVFGGSKYIGELRKANKFFRLFKELETAGKIIRLCDKKVDSHESDVSVMEPSKKFNDKHLVAIILASKCRIICTDDKESNRYLKDKRFYSKNVKKPLLYTSDRNKDMLHDGNIAEICKPCGRLKKQVSNTLDLER